MAGKGTLVAYSTAPGAVAEDGDGRSNSVFTAELVDALAPAALAEPVQAGRPAHARHAAGGDRDGLSAAPRP